MRVLRNNEKFGGSTNTTKDSHISRIYYKEENSPNGLKAALRSLRKDKQWALITGVFPWLNRFNIEVSIVPYKFPLNSPYSIKWPPDIPFSISSLETNT
jgi:hypothetical protein